MSRSKSVALYSDQEFRKWFEEVYQSNFERLYRYAYSITKSKTLAEDTVSEVFFNLWNNRPHYNDIKELNAYLHVSVKHQAIRLASKDPRKFTYSDYDESLKVSDAVDPESLLLGKELQQIVNNIIESLSPQSKLVYDLSKNRGLSYQEIADELGISKKTVESHLYTVTKRIKTELEAHFRDSGQSYPYFKNIGMLAGLVAASISTFS